MNATGGRRSWTGRVRERGVAALPPDRLLPETQPIYVVSWVYIFGVLTPGAFVWVITSGLVLAVEGPSWWHHSTAGRFVNSTHLWSVELFFFLMVLHLWAKFFMAAWRGKRGPTWITGVIAFVVSITTGFTGYVSQQNFDSQWIGTQAKDGLNAAGIGAFFNVLNFGQMLMWHILLLPAALGFLIVVHILMVRRLGVAPPLPGRAQKESTA